MNTLMNAHTLPHRRAEEIQDAIANIEIQIMLCHDAIRFHATPELQYLADALAGLYGLMDLSKRSAKTIASDLYQDFLANNSLQACQVAKGGEA